MSGLLDDAADWFKRRKTLIRSWYEDDVGRYAFGVVIDGQSFVVTAKQYLNDGQASFMARKVVQRAIDTDAYLLLFTGTGTRLVFNPIAVDQYGTHNATHEQGRKTRGEDWVDVTADLGVPFEQWADGDAIPPARLADADADADGSSDDGQ